MKSPFEAIINIPTAGLVDFFYGLTFFVLGISILITYKRASDLIIVSSLWLLAVFGFLHSIYIWLEFYVLMQQQYLLDFQIYLINGLRVLLYISSFLFLMYFGLVIISNTVRNMRCKWCLLGLPLILLLLWTVPLRDHLINMSSDLLNAAYTSAKYTIGVTAALLAAYGLWRFSHVSEGLSTVVTKKIVYASFSFLIFSIAIVIGIIPFQSEGSSAHLPLEIVTAIAMIMITYFILTALNVFEIETKRKLEKKLRLFEQSEKLISIGRLAAGVAHEINNPLANASLNIEIIKTRLTDINNPEIKSRLNNAEANILKAAMIARELLQFSRETEPDLVAVDLNDVIKGTLVLMKHNFTGMNVKTNLTDSLVIMGDPIKLEQVMVNILDNASDAMKPDDEIRIESSVHNDKVQIIIADDGAGISKENLSKVFDPFFTSKEIGKGTGLGLSLCYGIIDKHGGDIDIVSTEGAGTTVTITLPLHINL